MLTTIPSTIIVSGILVNQIEDEGFELDDGSWTFTNSEITSLFKRSGSNSGYMATNTGGAGEQRIISQIFSSPITLTEIESFECWIFMNTDIFTDSCYLNLTYGDATSEQSLVEETDVDTWELHDLTEYINDDKNSLVSFSFYLVYIGSYGHWFDDFTLEIDVVEETGQLAGMLSSVSQMLAVSGIVLGVAFIIAFLSMGVNIFNLRGLGTTESTNIIITPLIAVVIVGVMILLIAILNAITV